MREIRFVDLDVHKESIAIAVAEQAGGPAQTVATVPHGGPRLGARTLEQEALDAGARELAKRFRELGMDADDELDTELEAYCRLEEEVRGPFCAFGSVPPEVARTLDDVTHYLVLGYRQTYGLELLRGSMSDLQAWLTRDMPMA